MTSNSPRSQLIEREIEKEIEEEIDGQVLNCEASPTIRTEGRLPLCRERRDIEFLTNLIKKVQ